MSSSIKINIEIPLLLIFFCWLLSDNVSTNFVIYRVCYISLGYNQTECALLGTNTSDEVTKDLEAKAQPIASIILMCKTIIEVIISVFFSLIIGPWSNKHGRKPILISSITGFFFAYCLMIVLCLIPWSSPWYILLCSLPVATGGGLCSLLTVSFCYITDVTPENNRGLRMGILEAFFSLGTIIGTLSSSYILNAIGYIGIFSICAAVIFIAICYTYFFIPESVPVVETENKMKDLFDISVIVSTLKTVFKQRPYKDRTLLILLMLILIMFIFVLFSDSGIFFLFIREKFGWSLKQYTYFSAATSLIDIFTSIFMLLVLHKYLRINEMTLVLLGFVALSTSSVIFGIANRNWMIYLGAGIKRLSCTIGPLGRAAISKVIPPDEIGHIFAFTTSLESIVQLVSSPLYTLVYNNTLNKLPSAFNFLSASIYGISILVTCSIIFIQRFLYSGTNQDLRVIT